MPLSDFDTEKDENKGQGPLANDSKHKSDPSKYNEDKNKGKGPKNPDYNKQRMAGDKLRRVNAKLLQAQENGNEKRIAKLEGKQGRLEDKIYGNLNKFDGAAAGAGAQKGVDRISKKDIHELVERHGAKAVKKYMKKGAGQNSKFSPEAQGLLNRYVGKINGDNGGGNDDGSSGGGNDGGNGGGADNGGNNGGNNGDNRQTDKAANNFVSKWMNASMAGQTSTPHYQKYLEDEVNLTKLDERIAKRSQYHEAKGKLIGLNVFGDYDAYKASDWTSPLGADPIESYDPSEDTEDIYDQINKAAG